MEHRAILLITVVKKSSFYLDNYHEIYQIISIVLIIMHLMGENDLRLAFRS